MILCYVLAIAALNLGLGFVAAAYLRQRYEERAERPVTAYRLAASEASRGCLFRKPESSCDVSLDQGVGFCVTGGSGGNYNDSEWTFPDLSAMVPARSNPPCRSLKTTS